MLKCHDKRIDVDSNIKYCKIDKSGQKHQIHSHGLSETGFATDTSVPENDIRYMLMKQSKRKVLLIDSTKINKGYWHNLCDISEFDDVICDTPFPNPVMQKIKNLILSP